MKKFNIRDIFFSTLIMFLVCVIVTGLLAGTNYLTAKKIAQNDLQQEENMRFEVLKMATDFKAVDMNSDGETDYYEGYNGEDVIGYVMVTSAKGYGGDISVMTGILFDGKINKIAILSHNETPGLGANADTEDFTSRFKQSIADGGVLEVVKDGNAADGQIDAITGATITSKAVTAAVNDAIDIFRTVTAEKENSNASSAVVSEAATSDIAENKGSDNTDSADSMDSAKSTDISDKGADANG